MEHIFREWWWLMFPIMGFGFGAFGMYMGYRAHRDRMELLRIYAEKGQTPPPEIAKAAEANPYADPYGYGYRGRWGRRGPYWEWRRVIVFTSLAIGFGLANYWDGDNQWGWHHNDFGFPFSILTIIFGVMAAGSLLFAILATVWRDK